MVAAAVAAFSPRRAHAVYCEPFPVYGDSSPTLTLKNASVSGRALTAEEQAEYAAYRYLLHIDAPNSPKLELIVVGDQNVFQEVYSASK